MRPVRIIIVDKNDITRKGLEGIIVDTAEPYQVEATFQSLHEADDFVENHLINVMIIDDTTLRSIDVVRLVRRCYEVHPGLGIVVMSQRRDGDYIEQVMHYGNAGFIIKSSDLQEQLLKALQLVSEKYPFLSKDAAKLIGRRREGSLTHRDMEVLRLLEKELSVKEIASRLDISIKTVYRVRDKIKLSLGVRNNEILVDAARKQGLLEQKE